jgi:hypothetical protein
MKRRRHARMRDAFFGSTGDKIMKFKRSDLIDCVHYALEDAAETDGRDLAVAGGEMIEAGLL